MHRFRSIDTNTLTLRAQLFPDEHILLHQTGVGLYDGKEKDDSHSDGTLYLTSHRLIYVDLADPHRQSCFLDLEFIRQTEYWIGFLKSSPKITLLLGEPSHYHHPPLNPDERGDSNEFGSDSIDEAVQHPASAHWTCQVCAFSNLPSPKCGLCGVPRPASVSIGRSMSSSSITSPLSSPTSRRSLPRTGSNLSSIRSPSSMPNASFGHGIPSGQISKEIPCPTCTFLNHPSMTRCEMCDSILGIIQLSTADRSSAEATRHSNCSSREEDSESSLQHSHATTPGPPASFPSNSYIRLSFRKAGDKPFYAALKAALQKKAWAIHNGRSSGRLGSPASPTVMGSGTLESPRAIGIDGILKSMDSKHQADHTELSEGLRDLEALMTKAKEMVQMAQILNTKLTALESNTSMSSDSPSDSSVTIIRSSLVKLGLPTPAVTPDMMASDQAYEAELAKELAGLLTRVSDEGGPMMQDGPYGSKGIVSLDQIWCIWNRARGVAACQLLPQSTNPKLRLTTFQSGLKALHTPYYSTTAFGHRLIRILNEAQEIGEKGMTTLEIAQAEGLAVSLSLEMVEMVENDFESPIVRDEEEKSSTRWFPNWISGFEWIDPNVR